MKPRLKFHVKAGGTAPVFPPTITSGSAFAVSEGIAIRIPLTTNQGGATWSIVGGPDAALGTIDVSDLVLSAKDFEVPVDADANNVYNITVRVTTANGHDDLPLSITIQDVAEGGSGNSIKIQQKIYATSLVATALAAAAADEWITLAVTGNIKAEIWLKAENSNGKLVLGNGQSMAFRKNELMDMPVANASTATEGATGTWTYTWSGGGTSSIPWLVNSYPLALDYPVGKRTPAGYGGPSCAEDLPGLASDWTIFSQSTPGAFLKNANNRIVPAGTYGSAKTIGTPAHGTVYTVVMRHGPGTYADRTYTFTIDSAIINVAPNPGVDVQGSSASNQYINAFISRFHGDRVVMENGVYNTGASSRVVLANTYFFRATNPETSQTKLVLSEARGPYGSGSKEYTGLNHDAGWVTFESRYPLGADTGPVEWDNRSVKVDGVNTVGYIGTRHTGLSGTMPRFNNLSGATPMALEWIMVDHCAFAGYGPMVTSRDYHQCVFINHNWCHDTGTGIFLIARHSQVVGNLMERIQNDPFNLYMYDTTMTSWDLRWSRWDWNTSVRKDYNHPYPRTDSNKPHPDANQIPQLDSTVCPLLFATASNYKVPYMLQRGNLMLRTNGVKQPNSSGVPTAFDEPDQQGYNGGTMKTVDRLHDLRDLGNAYQCMFQMGIAPSCVDKDTSFVRHNTLTQAFYQNNWNTADVGYTGYVQPEMYLGTGASWAGNGAPFLDHNAIQNSGAGGYNIVPATPVPNTPTQTGVVHNAGASDFVDNSNGDTWTNVEKWCGGPVVKANLAPSVTSRLRPGQANYPASGTRVIGAFDNLSIIDHRLRTVNATYMTQ